MTNCAWCDEETRKRPVRLQRRVQHNIAVSRAGRSGWTSRRLQAARSTGARLPARRGDAHAAGGLGHCLVRFH